MLLLLSCLRGGDVDLDGFLEPRDCDDRDAAVYPGAPDSYGDDVDQDCDGFDGSPCELGGAWTDILNAPDPKGDAGGFPFDIRRYQYQYRDENPPGAEVLEAPRWLALRAESWTPFNLDKPPFQIDMHVDNDIVGYNLSYDAVETDPAPYQLWSSLNGWVGPLNDETRSLFYCNDSNRSVVVGVDLRDIGFDSQTWLDAYVQAGWWEPNPEQYEDDAPDDVPWDHGLICLTGDAHLILGDQTVLDPLGDADGRIDGGETVEITVALNIACGGATGSHTAVLVESSFNEVPLTILDGEVGVNDGDALLKDTTVTLDAPFRVAVGDWPATLPNEPLQVAFVMGVLDESERELDSVLVTFSLDTIP